MFLELCFLSHSALRFLLLSCSFPPFCSISLYHFLPSFLYILSLPYILLLHQYLTREMLWTILCLHLFLLTTRPFIRYPNISAAFICVTWSSSQWRIASTWGYQSWSVADNFKVTADRVQTLTKLCRLCKQAVGHFLFWFQCSCLCLLFPSADVIFRCF